MSMKFGLINFLENPAGKSERQIVAEQKYLCAAAEEYGFDSVWPVEHHFSDYGHCVSASVMLGTLASATRLVRLGSGVIALPLRNPIRVAEEFALIDLLSDGRLDFGVGRGFQPSEFDGYGVDQGKSREIFNEALEVILQAWTRDRVNFAGQHFRFENVAVRPKPIQKPYPPIWMAAVSPESYIYAGNRGLNLVCSPILGDPEAFARNLDAYRESLRANRHDPASRQIAAMFMVYVAPSMATAENDFSEHATWCYHALGSTFPPSDGASPIPTYERYAQLRESATSIRWADIRESDGLVWGTPEQCIEKIARLRERFGFTTMLCWTRVGALDNRKVLASMAMMQDYVIPHFHRADRR